MDLTVTPEQLADHFRNRYNSVTGAKVITDPVRKLSKGYGFVSFSNQYEANQALEEMNGSYLKGKPIKTSQSFSKNSNNNPGGGYNPNHKHNNHHAGKQQGGGGQQAATTPYMQQYYPNGMAGGMMQPGGNILGGLGVQMHPTDPRAQYMLQQQYALAAFHQQQQVKTKFIF